MYQTERVGLATAAALLCLTSIPATASATTLIEMPTPSFDLSGRACDFPLRWQVGDLDPRFGLSADEAAGYIRRAGLLWEGAAGRPLMFQESSDGIRVHFVFDQRQQDTFQRLELEAGLRERDRVIEEGRRQIESLESRLESREVIHRARDATFQQRQRSYNEAVELWNRAGGAPSGERQRLELQRAEVDRARDELNAVVDEINALIGEANALTAEINEQIRVRNAEAESILERYPPSAVQSGQYIDERVGIGRLTLTRDTEIRIFQFEDPDHLVRVIAHELGHAMGLEHTGVDGTLMAEEIISAQADVEEADVQLLRELCPDL